MRDEGSPTVTGRVPGAGEEVGHTHMPILTCIDTHLYRLLTYTYSHMCTRSHGHICTCTCLSPARTTWSHRDVNGETQLADVENHFWRLLFCCFFSPSKDIIQYISVSIENNF